MNKQLRLSLVSDDLTQIRINRKEFPDATEQAFLWSEWVGMIAPCYYKGKGVNKCYDFKLQCRSHIFRKLCNLVDTAVMKKTSTAVFSHVFFELSRAR